jgi:hypothetical protein
MSFGESLVAALFVGGVIATYAAAGGFLLLVLLRRRPLPRRLRLVRNAVWALALLGGLCILYSFLEPYRLTVEYLRLASDNLPPGRGIRIVQISDLHSDSRPRLERKIVETVARLEPEVIVFTGDAANSPEGIPVFKECLRGLSAIAPTFAVRGNWDTRAWSPDLQEGTGARELQGDGMTLDMPGGRLWICGAPVWESWWAKPLAAQAPPGACKLFLYHSPDGIEPAAEAGMDLCLTGHTHGGQVALPFYGAIVTLTRSGRKYQRGLYRVKDTWAYVNRGIGMEGRGVPRVRFCSPPEITVIDLVPPDAPASPR